MSGQRSHLAFELVWCLKPSFFLVQNQHSNHYSKLKPVQVWYIYVWYILSIHLSRLIPIFYSGIIINQKTSFEKHINYTLWEVFVGHGNPNLRSIRHSIRPPPNPAQIGFVGLLPCYCKEWEALSLPQAAHSSPNGSSQIVGVRLKLHPHSCSTCTLLVCVLCLPSGVLLLSYKKSGKRATLCGWKWLMRVSNNWKSNFW